MFELSKIVWLAFDPGNVLLILLLAGVALTWSRSRRPAGEWLIAAVTAAFLVIAVAPVWAILILPLEERFPIPDPMPDRVDGIIVLGGAFAPELTRGRGQVALKDGAERYTEFVRLARRYPGARLVFTGGSGDLVETELKEAPVARRFFAEMGLDPGRIAFEDQSRNTWENALYSLSLVQPKPGERWLLVTSAKHMPRSVGVFRRAGWPVIPYPVDYLTRGSQSWQPRFGFIDGLDGLERGSREWIGLLAYRLMGRTDALFPAP